MDTGRQTDYDFYKGFEGEPEFVISLMADPKRTVHIWAGYLDDIFAKTEFSNDGWIGMTRDYQELRGAFEESGPYIVPNALEYYEDLRGYKGQSFQYDETKDVLEVMLDLFQCATESGQQVQTEYL